MILTLSASIMYWSLLNSEENSTPETSPVASADGEHETDLVNEVSDLAIDDNAAENANSP
jgi:plastin-1